LFAKYVAAFDRSYRLELAEGRLGRSQGSKALTVSKDPFHGRVITFDEVVAPLLVDMPDAVKMWVIVTIDLADNTSIGRSIICDDGDWAMEPYTLNGIVRL